MEVVGLADVVWEGTLGRGSGIICNVGDAGEAVMCLTGRRPGSGNARRAWTVMDLTTA